MVLCLIALPVLAILGLFSIKYRLLAKEAFRCLFRSVQLKPCDTGFDQRIKAKATAKLMFWPALAKFVYKRFTVLSWIFVALLVASTYYTAVGAYNYAVYGNCNGAHSDSFCVFNVVMPEQESCSTVGAKKELNPDAALAIGPVRGNPNAKLTIIEYGCYVCPYTKQAEAELRQILADYPSVNLVYHDVPLNIHNNSFEAANAALCAKEQGKYWEFHDMLFEKQEQIGDLSFGEFASQAGLNVSQFNSCFEERKYQAQVDRDYKNAMDVGIYGTPTFIINDATLVGPQKYKTLKAVIEDELE